MDVRDPEKGQIPLDMDGPIQHHDVANEEDDKELDTGSNREDHSMHSEHAFSADSIEHAPVQVTQSDARSKSRSSSVRSRPLSIIPRSKRRGLLGRFAIIPEVERPHEYGNGTKWAITAIVALAAAAAPVGSAIFYRRFFCSCVILRLVDIQFMRLFTFCFISLGDGL
jgi:hypothetical protein